MGNGQKIPIKNANWLPEEGHRRIISPLPAFSHDAKVADLMRGSPLAWDSEKIRASFLPYDAEAILQIPLSSRSPPDKLIWHATRDGKYSVRSGYHILLQEAQNSNPGSSRHGEKDPIWKTIWSMFAPAKIRSFLWRACHESLPSKLGLMRRKIVDSPWCEMCGSEVEDCLHALWKCPAIVSTWSMQHELADIRKIEHSSFRDLVRQVGTKNRDLILEYFAATCWLLWHKRNQSRLHLPSVDYAQIRTRAEALIQEYTNIQSKEQRRSPQNSKVSWQPPTSNKYKVNFDGAIFRESKEGGIGVVVRDQQGLVIATLSQRVKTCLSAEMIEARAAKRAIQFALEIGIFDANFEGDSELIIREISSQEAMHTVYGLVLEDAKALLHLFERYRFTHTRRSGNNVAHALACRASNIQNLCVWMEDVPPDITPILYSDFSSIN